MELTQLRYFVLVAEHGSTAKAAGEAMVSQSTISKSLLHLEQELGISLFDRLGNHLVLNPAGRELLQQARPVLTAVRQIPEAVKGHHRPRQHYRINASAAQPVMGALVHQILQVMPEAEVRLSQGDWIDDCDLSIAAAPSGRQEDCLLLLEEEILLAVPKAQLPRDGSPLRLETLRLLLPPQGTSLRARIDQHLLSLPAGSELHTVTAHPETIRQLVAWGDGAAFWPAKTWPQPDRDRTALVPLQGPPLGRELYAMLPPQRAWEDLRGLLPTVQSFFSSLEPSPQTPGPPAEAER